MAAGMAETYTMKSWEGLLWDLKSLKVALSRLKSPEVAISYTMLKRFQHTQIAPVEDY